MKIIDITNDTIHKEHICCCLSDKQSESGVHLKKDWLRNQFLECLKFKRLNERGNF